MTVTVTTTVVGVAEHFPGGVVVLGGGLGKLLLELEDGGAGGTVPNEGVG